jgi:acyl-CoA dehydrogenase
MSLGVSSVKHSVYTYSQVNWRIFKGIDAMAVLWFLLYTVVTLVVLAYGLNALIWEIASGIYLVIATVVIGLPWYMALLLWGSIGLVIVLRRSLPVREQFTDLLFKRAQVVVPKLSETEEAALNAGDTWIEKSIFTGNPDWQALSAIKTSLTPAELAFLEQDTETLCAMLDDWQITQQQDLPQAVWAYLKQQGFFGLVIPTEYGGKGFSARAHSDIVMKIASRSGVAAVTVMVPNSLGPGELIYHYGTDTQKSYYLPRLAQGEEIPCFALTEPQAGSDATSIQSQAIVVKKVIDGETVIGLSITLNKRWITLAPVATLIGLAVNVADPDGLLTGSGREGITCVLVPRDTPNLEIGNRHLPAEQPFMNGTVRGTDVFVPLDHIIGGPDSAGHGWQMLVECLSIGRSISLPALATASSSVAYITTGAFARVRRQFNVEIGHFEGVEAKLAEIAGLNYLICATRLLTVAAVDQHKKPSVASAIAKYFNTELARIVINNAMDVHAGRAVVSGPRNYLLTAYQGIPISVTVEGANIMTRNLLIFGQGSMACHPFIREEFYAVRQQDKAAFGQLIWQHATYFLHNFAKTVLSAWTGGYLISTPNHPLRRSYQRLAHLSYAFAWLADLSLMVLGGDLKRKERLSARLADALSYLYIAMAALRVCQDEDTNQDEVVHAQWGVDYCFYQAEQALLGLCRNFPVWILGKLMRFAAFPFGARRRYPSDKADHKLAQRMTSNNHYRQGLLRSVYLSGQPDQPIDRVECAFQALIEQAPLYKKIRGKTRLSAMSLKQDLADLVTNGVINSEEMQTILAVESARWDAIQVDEFDFDAMKNKSFDSITNHYPNPLN